MKIRLRGRLLFKARTKGIPLSRLKPKKTSNLPQEKPEKKITGIAPKFKPQHAHKIRHDHESGETEYHFKNWSHASHFENAAMNRGWKTQAYGQVNPKGNRVIVLNHKKKRK